MTSRRSDENQTGRFHLCRLSSLRCSCCFIFNTQWCFQEEADLLVSLMALWTNTSNPVHAARRP